MNNASGKKPPDAGSNFVSLFVKTSLVYLIAALLVSTIFLSVQKYKYVFRVNYPSPVDVTAPHDMQIEDNEATKKVLSEARKKAPAFFIFDNTVNTTSLQKIRKLLRRRDAGTLKSFLYSQYPKIKTATVETRDVLKLGKVLLKILSQTERAFIVEERPAEFRRAVIRKGDTDQMVDIRMLETVNQFIKRTLPTLLQDYKLSAYQDLVTPVLRSLVRPNTFLNEARTKNAVMAAVSRDVPVRYILREGEVVIRKGDIVTSEDMTKINAIMKEKRFYHTLSWYISASFLLALILIVVSYLVHQFADAHITLKDAGFVGLLVILQATFLRTLALTGWTSSYVIPFIYLPLLAASIIRKRHLGLILILSAGLLPGLYGLPSGWFLSLTWFLSGAFLLTVLIARQIKRRLDFLIYGFAGAAAGAPIAFFVCVLGGAETPEALHSGLFYGAACMFSGVLAIGVLPAVERIFRYTTNVYLLELASLNHPLLRELAIRAPGTYNHSIMVGTLSEAAAESIGANPVLVRVAAYFHDIGKMKKPNYFVENQKGGENPHNRYTPSMSALVIISHIRYGVEMAHRHGLPDEIVDAVREHHGTSLIQYFYERAREKSENPDEVPEEDFRYPGPKPRTKESAIIMLADAVEAAARTLKNPTDDQIAGMVQRIINRIFADGQLEDAPLTLKDLHLIARSFIHVLVGIYHRRIDYPRPAFKGTPPGEEVSGAEKENHERQSERKTGGEDKEEIKRLGTPKY